MTASRSPRLLAILAGAALILLLAMITGGTARAASSDVTYAEWSATAAVPAGGGTIASFQADPTGHGFDVFFDDAGHVFNIWSKDATPFGSTDTLGAVDCHMVATGATCGAGWPFKVGPLHTNAWATGHVDNATRKLWFPTNTSTSAGFGCIDLSNFTTGPAWCGGSSDPGKGYVEFAGSDGPADPGSFNAVNRLAVNGTKLYTLGSMLGPGASLLCLDMATGAPCSTPSVPLPGAPWVIFLGSPAGLVSVGGYIYGFASDSGTPKAFCVKADMTACAGASYSFPAGSGSVEVNPTVYLQPDAAGTTQGVCFKIVETTASDAANCYTPDGSATTVPTDGGLAKSLVLNAADAHTYFPLPQTTGTRVYSGDGRFVTDGSVGCFDVATKASCAGWPVTTSAYAITIDPYIAGCVWTNNQATIIKSFNANGVPGCVSTSALASAKFAPVVPCTGGAITGWSSFALTAPAATDYKGATLTVAKADGTVVKSGGKTWKGLKVTGKDRTVSLAGLAVKDTGKDPSFTVTYTGRTGTADSKAAIVMEVAKAKGCTKTVAPPTAFTVTTSTTVKGKVKRLNVGDTTTVSFAARNTSKTAAKGAKFSAKVPAGFRLVSASGAKVKGRTVTWTVGTLKSKASALRSMTIVAIGRGKHSVGFTVTASNLPSATSRSVTFLVRGTGSEPVTG